MWNIMDHGYEQLQDSNREIYRIWQQEVLFTWKWWFIFLLTVLPWIVVFLYTKREHRKQYVIAAMILMCLSTVLDLAGLTFDLWRYYVSLVPILGGFFPWNFSMIPMFFVLSYEMFRTLHPTWKGAIVSVLFSYVGEPLTEIMGLTMHHRWVHTFSLPIYFVIYLIAYYGSQALCRSGNVSSERSDRDTYLFENSFDSIYFIEKQHGEKNFRFSEINENFCKEMGYTREELMKLDPRVVSDQERYSPDIKYKPLYKTGNMDLDTTFVTKAGEKRFVRIKVKVFSGKDKIEVLTIARFLAQEVAEDHAT
jgi:PAS domain S-box-containing protein